MLEGDAVGPVCHYIHLNAVRAGLVDAGCLQSYQDSSFWQLWYPRKRWEFVNYETCLQAAGGLVDSPQGRSSYRDYLAYLSEDEKERKKQGFDKMCRGWAKGSKAFKKAVLEDLEDPDLGKVVEAEAGEMREPRWEKELQRGLECLARSETELKSERKGAVWKVALARHLRERHLVPNSWLAERLSMGTPNSLSSQISRHRKANGNNDTSWEKLQNQENVD